MMNVIVIGGGLSGLLVARELAIAGAKPRILELGSLGREASWAGGGILSPLYPWRYDPAVTDLTRISQTMYPELCEALRVDTGIDPEFTPGGMYVLDAEEVGEANRWARLHDCVIEMLGPDDLERREPQLTAPGGALWLPHVAQLRNPRILQALKRDLEQRGVALDEQTPVGELVVEQGRVTGVIAGGATLTADAVVVTAGAWSRDILRGVGVDLDVFPVKGQMLLYKLAVAPLRSVVVSAGHYLVPRRDGHLLVGSTMEETGFDKATTEKARGELQGAAATMLPALAACVPVQHWAGLRPGSPRGVPFIGPIPGIDGLFVNAGHFRNGVAMGPAAARLAVDWVLGRVPCVAQHAYLAGT